MRCNKGVFVDNTPEGCDLFWDTEGDADTEANPVQNNPARLVFHMASEQFPPAPGARASPLHLALLYYSFSDLIWFNSGLHRFNLSMKNALWHFIWLPRMCSGWPSFLMKLFKGPAAQHYWHSLNIGDRLGVCNKLCCTVPLGQNWRVEISPFNTALVWALVLSTPLRRWHSQNRCLHPFSVNDLFTSALFVI